MSEENYANEPDDVRGTAMVMTLLDVSMSSIQSAVALIDRKTGNRLLAMNALLRELHDALQRWKFAVRERLVVDGLDNQSFDEGYRAGWVDALTNQKHQEEPLAWAIIDREREKVRFETFRPERIKPGETVVPLYGRPDFPAERGGE